MICKGIKLILFNFLIFIFLIFFFLKIYGVNNKCNLNKLINISNSNFNSTNSIFNKYSLFNICIFIDYKKNIKLKNIYLNFPLLQNKFVLNIGMMPYNSLYYIFNKRISIMHGVKFLEKNIIFGDILKFYFSSGILITKKIFFGIKNNFLFGKVNRRKSKIGLNKIEINEFFFRDFNFIINLLYKKKINNKNFIFSSFFFRLKSNIFGKRIFYRNKIDFQNLFLYKINYLKLPLFYGLGISYIKTKNYLFYLEFFLKNFPYLINYLLKKKLLQNSYKLSLGLIFKLKKKYFFNLYRLSFTYLKIPCYYKKEVIKDFSLISNFIFPSTKKFNFNFVTQLGFRIKNNVYNYYYKIKIGINFFNKI